MNELVENENWAALGIFTTNDIKRMLDVEYVSELTIAILNGHQNKNLLSKSIINYGKVSFRIAIILKNYLM